VQPVRQKQMPLIGQSKKWLITGVAGFIGSNLLEELLNQDQEVIGVDNLSTGFESNLVAVKSKVGTERWKRFQFHLEDICNEKKMSELAAGCHYILHQAALGSIPRSIANPMATHHANVTGFVSILNAARTNNIKKVVFASSSSVYGSSPDLPKLESNIGEPLSPYAGTKLMNEIYAEIFFKTYKLPYIGLRYFNVFGPRQSPAGEYAAVIPRWIHAAANGQTVTVNGDGETSRDFCYIDNAVQANIRAALAPATGDNKVFNVACGAQNTLNTLLETIMSALKGCGIDVSKSKIIRREFRQGDIRHSLADISSARNLLGYEPTHDLFSGVTELIKTGSFQTN
jgi:UDP-N-acetylglucosamine 4-epimerase